MPIGTITKAEVQAWVYSLETTGLASATVKREHQALQKVFAWAVDEAELIVRTPCRKIRFTEILDPGDRRLYTPEEIERLYNAFDPRYRAMILTGCYAGLRIGEMAALHKDHFSLLERRIHVRQGLTEVGGRVHIGPLKTKHSRGTVEIPDFLADELGEHLGKWGSDGLVFTSPEGGPLRPTLWRQRFWHPAVARSIGEPARPHDMRHSFVSLLIDQRMSVEKVCGASSAQ
jgi:integrase